MRFTFPGFGPQRNLPEKAVIKKKAHALTMLTVAWIGMSILAVVAYKVGKEDGDASWIAAAVWTWRMHAVFASLTLLFWTVEKPSEVRYLKEHIDDEEA